MSTLKELHQVAKDLGLCGLSNKRKQVVICHIAEARAGEYMERFKRAVNLNIFQGLELNLHKFYNVQKRNEVL